MLQDNTARVKAIAASEKAKCPRSYWDWQPVLERNRRGEYPYTPATVLLFGLREALAMLSEEGLENVFGRHARLAEACRRSVRGMGLQLLAKNPEEYSNTLTAVLMPYMALICTAAGLLVAIPAVAAFNHFNQKISLFESELRWMIDEVLDGLAERAHR